MERALNGDWSGGATVPTTWSPLGEITTTCEELADEGRLEHLSFWLGTVPRLCLCCAGLVANGFIVIVFSDPDFGASDFNRLLACLAYVDGSYLFFCAVEDLILVTDAVINGSVEQWPNPGGALWVMLYPQLLHPAQQIFLMASSLITMAVSINR
jgi:hypothetical protein